MSITRFTGVSGPGDSRELVEQVTMTDDVGKLVAHAIYKAWQSDERWLRLDLATVAKGNPLAFFWAEIAASAALAANSRKAPDMDALLSAIASCEAWIDRWTSHVGRCEGGDKCTCGRTAVLSEARAAIIE